MKKYLIILTAMLAATFMFSLEQAHSINISEGIELDLSKNWQAIPSFVEKVGNKEPQDKKLIVYDKPVSLYITFKNGKRIHFVSIETSIMLHKNHISSITLLPLSKPIEYTKAVEATMGLLKDLGSSEQEIKKAEREFLKGKPADAKYHPRKKHGDAMISYTIRSPLSKEGYFIVGRILPNFEY